MHLLKLTCLDRRGNEFYKIIYLHFLKYQTFYHNFKLINTWNKLIK